MNCPQCGTEVSERAAFCRTCGAPMAPPDPTPRPPDAGTPPYYYQPSGPQAGRPGGPGYPGGGYPGGPGYPPGQWGPPPPSGGHRTLLIVLALSLGLLLLIAGVAAALIIPAVVDRTTEATTAESEAGTTSTLPPGPATTAGGGVPSTTSTEAPRTPTGTWVEVDVPQPAGEVYMVAVSDAALVVDTANGLYASMLSPGAAADLIALPKTKGQAGAPTLDGPLAVWWEGDYDEGTGTFSGQTLYSMRLPDGPKVEAVGGGRAAAYPQISNGYLTWVEPAAPGGDPESEIWNEPLFGVPLGRDGSAGGEPDLLTSAPRAYVIGDSSWTYSLSGTLLAWEQHEQAEGLSPGVYYLDLAGGAPHQLGAQGAARPSIAGSTVVFHEEALEAVDLTTDRQWVIDPAGDWPAAAGDFVVYLRATGDSAAWDIVARSLTGDAEQNLGTQTTPPWLSSPLVAAPHHIAFVDDQSRVRLFERRG